MKTLVNECPTNEHCHQVKSIKAMAFDFNFLTPMSQPPICRITEFQGDLNLKTQQVHCCCSNSSGNKSENYQTDTNSLFLTKL